MKGEAEDIEEVLFDQVALQQRIQKLGVQLALEYADKAPVVLSTLKGCFMFFADLVRTMHPCPKKMEIDFLTVHSYGSETESSGVVTVDRWCSTDLTDRHVLLVDDICDTGLTLKFLVDSLAPVCASLKTIVLLNKDSRRQADVTPDYVCFPCPDKFVVGYGMDFNQRYRTLPFIGVLKASAAEIQEETIKEG